MIKSAHTATVFSKEAELYNPVSRFFRTKGFKLQLPEMPFYEYRIDMYSFSKKTDSTVAVELKLTDWRRALEQAMVYQLCADLVYVAMPTRITNKIDKLAFSSQGVGLIGVTNACKCELAVEAVEHPEVRMFYRQTQIEYLKDYANA
jgi:hypothetical protein